MSNIRCLSVKNILNLAGSLLIAALVGCGGGGGSAGTPSGGGSVATAGTVTAVIQDTLLNLQLRDNAGAITQSVAAAGGAEIVATLTTKAGVAVAGQRIVFDDLGSASSLISFPDGKSVTTDQNGLARLKISRLSLTKFGSGIVFARFTSNAQLAFASSDISVRVDPPALRYALGRGDPIADPVRRQRFPSRGRNRCPGSVHPPAASFGVVRS